jgi:outer membrane protein TolC
MISRCSIVACALLLGGISAFGQPPLAALPQPPLAPQPPFAPQPEQIVRPVGQFDGQNAMVQGYPSPMVAEAPMPVMINPAQLAPTDTPLPINLATALYLSNARPLVIASAEASVQEAAAQLRGAQVLALPNLNVGTSVYRHDGIDQSTDGTIILVHKTALAAGGGATADFAVTDALFLPLANRQLLAARQADVQTARNDALLAVAIAYFDVQQARGTLAGLQDAVENARLLVARTTSLARGLVPEVEIDRARAELYDLEQQAAVARANWRIASARLTRVLRLNPSAVVVPLEPPHLQVTLISPALAVGDLVSVGLSNRPELASQRAELAASTVRVRQERMRPLLPSIVVDGAGPGGYAMGGVFGGGPDGSPQVYGGRFEAEAGVVWTLQNMGAGNRALVRERIAQQQRAGLDFANTQDQVAQDVVEAHAALEAATTEVQRATSAVSEAAITYKGTLTGIGQTQGPGLVLVNRPQEAVAALIQLSRSYGLYFTAVNDYNRAQFQLYRALGYPARILVCDCPVGQPGPVDTSRPACMVPVCPTRPCP